MQPDVDFDELDLLQASHDAYTFQTEFTENRKAERARLELHIFAPDGTPIGRNAVKNIGRLVFQRDRERFVRVARRKLAHWLEWYFAGPESPELRFARRRILRQLKIKGGRIKP